LRPLRLPDRAFRERFSSGKIFAPDAFRRYRPGRATTAPRFPRGHCRLRRYRCCRCNLLVRAASATSESSTAICRTLELQRQTLFDESDALSVLPKAVAAERKLRAINSTVAVEGLVADLGSRNAEALLEGVDLLLDGTDNFERAS